MTAKPSGKPRTDFAPFAEALKVTTNSVLSAQADDSGRSYTVLYTLTPTRDPDAILYRAVLWTNIEGNLEVVENRALCSIGRFKAQVKLIMAGLHEPIDKLPGYEHLN